MTVARAFSPDHRSSSVFRTFCEKENAERKRRSRIGVGRAEAANGTTAVHQSTRYVYPEPTVLGRSRIDTHKESHTTQNTCTGHYGVKAHSASKLCSAAQPAHAAGPRPMLSCPRDNRSGMPGLHAQLTRHRLRECNVFIKM